MMTEDKFQIRLPANAETLNLNDEYFHVEFDGKEQIIGIHEYEKIYRIPGLYEHIVSRTLKCTSPRVVTELLLDQIHQSGGRLADHTVLDFGAGVGLVGDILSHKGARTIIGFDIAAEAAVAAQRNYPGVYEEYYVGDICRLKPDLHRELKDRHFSCLLCVGSLACGHVTGDVFTRAFNLIDSGGWVAFNVLKDFYTGDRSSGLSELIQRLKASNIMEIKVAHEYRHRYLMNGTPVFNVAVIGRKAADI
jgi:2-polyprenyl-3-methyl-5-hydroxy-6-metoxy-1,4-benzoquinol methylase